MQQFRSRLPQLSTLLRPRKTTGCRSATTILVQLIGLLNQSTPISTLAHLSLFHFHIGMARHIWDTARNVDPTPQHAHTNEPIEFTSCSDQLTGDQRSVSRGPSPRWQIAALRTRDEKPVTKLRDLIILSLLPFLLHIPLGDCVSQQQFSPARGSRASLNVWKHSHAGSSADCVDRCQKRQRFRKCTYNERYIWQLENRI